MVEFQGAPLDTAANRDIIAGMSTDRESLDAPPTFLHFDGMAWPNPLDPNEVQWRLRYGEPTLMDRMFAASVMNAYHQLVTDPQRIRNAKVRGIRETMRGD